VTNVRLPCRSGFSNRSIRMKNTTCANIENILKKHGEAIVHEWVRRLHEEVSPLYSSQSLKGLYRTVSEVSDANFAALTQDDFFKIDAVIEHIGRLREKTGFTLSEVQKAFELYRSILIPILETELKGSEAFRVLERLNDCLAYTVNKFSDYFQGLREREIRDYAQNLEVTVEMRTKELAESERKYRQLVEEIRDGYFVNQKGRIVFANQAFCDMHGYTMEEVVGREYTDFVAPESLKEVIRFYRKRMRSDHSKEQYVYFRLGKNGSSLPTENRVTLTRYQGEAAAIGICRDITERMEIERRVREAERLAHVGKLTASLAHEIRNPLSSANVSIQTMLKSLSVSGNDKRRLEILAKEVSRVDRLVTEMLDFAKPIKFNFRPAPLRPLIDSCLEVLDAKIRETDTRIRKSLSNRIPTVLLDWEKMEQAILNVLLNAIEAVTKRGEITISAKRSGDYARLEISDNGRGISAEDLPYIFDPFFSKKTKGIGLGLANAKRVIEAHGGRINARPLASGGTCVSIDLPLAK